MIAILIGALMAIGAVVAAYLKGHQAGADKATAAQAHAVEVVKARLEKIDSAAVQVQHAEIQNHAAQARAALDQLDDGWDDQAGLDLVKGARK